MSTSDDLLLEAAVPFTSLYPFLTQECGLAVGENDLHGNPIHYCDEFQCYTTELNEVQKGIFTEHLGFTPHIRLQCYIMSIPHVDCHPRLLDFLELLMMEYEGDIAWLIDCAIPQLVKRDNRILVQGDVSPYSHWAYFLEQSAIKLGLPFEIVKMDPI